MLARAMMMAASNQGFAGLSLYATTVYTGGTNGGKNWLHTAYDTVNDKGVMVFLNGSNYPTAVVFSCAADGTITFGSPATITATAMAEIYDLVYWPLEGCFMYSVKRNSDGFPAVGTFEVSGTTITNIIAPATWYGDTILGGGMLSVGASNVVTITWDSGSNDHRATAFRINAGSISQVGSTQFVSTKTVTFGDGCYDVGQNRDVFIYKNTTDNYATAVAVQPGVSPSTAPVVGTPVTIYSGGVVNTGTCLAYDSTNNKTVAFYSVSGGSLYAKILSLSGSTITPGSQVLIDSTYTSVAYVTAVYDPNAEAFYVRYVNTGTGKAYVTKVACDGSTLTPGTPFEMGTISDRYYAKSFFNPDQNYGVFASTALNGSSNGARVDAYADSL